MRNKSIATNTGHTGRNGHTGQVVSAKGIVLYASNPSMNLQAGQSTVPKSSTANTGHSGRDYQAGHVAIIHKGIAANAGHPIW